MKLNMNRPIDQLNGSDLNIQKNKIKNDTIKFEPFDQLIERSRSNYTSCNPPYDCMESFSYVFLIYN